MKENEFKKWLHVIKYPDSPQTATTRFANWNTIEKYYGDLSVFYKKDRCNALIEEFNYSTDDEREHRVPNHKVPIDGNIRNGSSTLKSTIRLYVEFHDSQDESTDLVPIDFRNQTIGNSKSQPFFNDILNLLQDFKYNKENHKDISILQQDINDFLNENMSLFNWCTEHKPKKEEKERKNVNDRIDIFGESNASDLKIIIELDAHRADQVAKKFLSRSALMINESIIYLSICYPGTEKMPKPECLKYFEYCSTVSKTLAEGSGKDKLYAGIFLE